MQYIYGTKPRCRTTGYVATILLLCSIYTTVIAGSGPVQKDIGEFNSAVRGIITNYSQQLLPDSTLRSFAKTSLRLVSEDIGGVEANIAVATVADQAFYAISDTIVQVMFGTILDGNVTKSIKAWYPQYFEEVFILDQLSGTSKDAVPSVFNIWGDSIQLIPVPVKADSVWLKAFVKHPMPDSLWWEGTVAYDTLTAAADSVVQTTLTSGTTDSIHIKFDQPYVEAAKMYACYLTFLRLNDYAKAQQFWVWYQERRQLILATYTKKFDTVGKQ